MGKVAADEGILSLYKGLLPVIIGSAPEMAVQVSMSWVFCCGSRSHTQVDPSRAATQQALG